MKWHCQICNTYFDKPFVKRYTDSAVDKSAVFQEILCPVCGQPYIDPSKDCPICGEPMTTNEIICKDCRKVLLYRLFSFADGLKEEEEDQLDEWMDGRSIKERSQFS